MRIAIISDTHFGFGEGTARESECFENAEQAIALALKENADAVILAGDVFDETVPSQEVLLKAFQVFSKLRNAEPKQMLSIEKVSRKGERKKVEAQGIPLIAIHGTHEFRGKDYANVLQLFEESGFLVYLHGAHALLSNGAEEVAVHGLGGVPEKNALDVLNKFNPRPLADVCNIFVMHQSIKEFLPFDDEMIASISLSDLPKGFDLVVNGHLHWCNEQEVNGSKFLLPGSTIITQMKRLEGEKPKGIYIFDSAEKKLSFHPLPKQRKLFYHKIKFEGASIEEVKEKLLRQVYDDLSEKHGLLPLIRLNLSGSLAKGFNPADLSIAEIEEEFKGKAILSISKDFSAEAFKKKISELREMQKEKQSVIALGYQILEKNLEETQFNNSFDAKKVFDLLAEGKVDEVVALMENPEAKK
ncbi:MAG: DNA repair exonuclease [Candidatus Diapherotrites archaeon]